MIPPGTSTTTGFHLGTPSNAPDTYATTPIDGHLLLKVDGSNTFSMAEVTPTPEPATLLLLGSGLVGAGIFGRKRLARKQS